MNENVCLRITSTTGIILVEFITWFIVITLKIMINTEKFMKQHINDFKVAYGT